jgi:hypothetical protein
LILCRCKLLSPCHDEAHFAHATASGLQIASARSVVSTPKIRLFGGEHRALLTYAGPESQAAIGPAEFLSGGSV